MFGMIARPGRKCWMQSPGKGSRCPPVMITGSPLTASISHASWIITTDRVVTGQELSKISDEELAQRVENRGVRARFAETSEDRDAAAIRGHIVAMTATG